MRYLSLQQTSNLGDDSLLEIEEHTRDLSKDSIIFHFKGFWPTLSELHAWISKHWHPYIMAIVEIFPFVKGFFIVTFLNSKDRKAILCDQVFFWENRFPLMVKPWNLDFNPQTESFKIPTWVRLPNFPLHFGVNSIFMEIGKALGDLCMVDSQSFEHFHSNYARILVDIDVSKGLLAKIILSYSKGSWTQSLDYEGLPFRCKKCFNTGHMVAKCEIGQSINK